MTSRLGLRIKPGRIARFAALLQRGFLVWVSEDSILEDVLRNAGFPRKYLEERVQTIFLDGSVIDDPGCETVGDGSVTALSAALPGLAGAIFRRGEPLAKLRTPTPKRARAKKGGDRSGYARIKLFNLVAEEMGPELLNAGLIMKRSDLEDELAARRGSLEPCVTGAELDGKAIDIDALFAPDFARSEHILVCVPYLHAPDSPNGI